MEQRIIKAEILLSRKCNLSCKYCGIIREDRKTDEFKKNYKEVLDNLKELGCIITPIYGAEPTMEWNFLVDFIKYAEEIGIATTVITNGLILSKSKKKIQELYDVGLRSITVSIDSLGPLSWGDKSVRRKAIAAQKVIEEFKGLEDIRDIEVSVTVTKENIVELPSLVKVFSNIGVWVSFDTLHWKERGKNFTALPDSKCNPWDDVKEYVLNDEDTILVENAISSVVELKKNGALVHTSDSVLDMWMNGFWRKLNWSCLGEKMGFITIDCDGSVSCGCDDFIPRVDNKFVGWGLVSRWEEFEDMRSILVKEYGCTCTWSTHVMSKEMVGTKEGVSNFLHTE